MSDDYDLPFSGNPDIIRRIALVTPYDSVAGLCKINKALAKLCRDDSFWKEKYARDFEPINYRKLYLRTVKGLEGSRGAIKAVKRGWPNLAIPLIEKYKDVYKPDDFGQMLYYTFINRDIDTMYYLLDNYVDVNRTYVIRISGDEVDFEPLNSAIIVGFYKAVKILLSYGAQILDNSLSLAIYWDDPHIIKLILERTDDSQIESLTPSERSILKRDGLI